MAEPFGDHPANGRGAGACVVRSAILPVDHAAALPIVARLLAEADPVAVVRLGLAAGRARMALERAAVNVMDYELADPAPSREPR